MEDIYQKCPTFTAEHITLCQTNSGDVQELLNCYSDEKAVPFFNSDNCHGDDFHYNTFEKMNKAVEFWDFSYRKRYFVRWTVILNETKEKIGTIEMFHRIADDDFNHFGVLRIDLQSRYEKQQVIDDILEIVRDNFYKAFNVEAIISKAIPEASERIASLIKNGYKPLNKKFMVYDDYFIAEN